MAGSVGDFQYQYQLLQGLKPCPALACEPPGLMGVLNVGTLPLIQISVAHEPDLRDWGTQSKHGAHEPLAPSWHAVGFPSANYCTVLCGVQRLASTSSTYSCAFTWAEFVFHWGVAQLSPSRSVCWELWRGEQQHCWPGSL